MDGLAGADGDSADGLGVVGDNLVLADAEAVEDVQGGVFQADQPAAARRGIGGGFIHGDLVETGV